MIEAKRSGGTLHTARFAKAQGDRSDQLPQTLSLTRGGRFSVTFAVCSVHFLNGKRTACFSVSVLCLMPADKIFYGVPAVALYRNRS